MHKRILTILFCFFLSTIFAQNTDKLKISHLTGDFYVFTTYNLYKGTPYPANGMYLLTNKGVVIFDSPWDTTQFQPLLDTIWQRHHKKAVMFRAGPEGKYRARAGPIFREIIECSTSKLSICRTAYLTG